jgi:DNA-binding CsgD family transcriptional regulator
LGEKLADEPAPRSGHSPNFEQLNYLLTGIFNATSVGIAVFDTQARLVISNPTFAFTVANSSPSTCIGKTIQKILGNGAEELEHAIKLVWETGQIESSVEVLKRVPHSGQSTHWLFNLIPIKDQAAGSNQVIAIAIETSHQKRIEQYFLTLMADIGSIRDHVRKDPATVEDRRKLVRPFAEEIDLLDAVSEEVRSVSAMLQDGPAGPPHEPGAVGQSELASELVSASPEPTEMDSLSEREREVLALSGAGKTTKEIATNLGISISSVATYRTRLERKLHLHSPLEVALYAVRKRLGSP